MPNAESTPVVTHIRVAALSLAVAVVLLAVKSYAWVLTGSQAIFSDAAESIVNVVAAAFAFRVLA
ncbi:MAG: cation-efflux pump, partial [Planctomycetes bacterium]|nr:cation-efflux pump [Planctomycetota bacterium]